MLADTAPISKIQTVADIFGTPVPTERFLRIAINMTAVLAEYHDKGFIHKHICPHCFLINPPDDAVTFAIDQIEITATHNQQTLLGYMSPEQTGRMNRAIDNRTDLYSLGIILYQLATGVPPFVAGDVLEWVHCHIARTPQAPVTLSGSLPLQISDIIMKLLAKSVEARYQTASGLKRDLEKCLAQFEVSGEVKIFSLGDGDISRQLLIPQKLYGRQKEIAQLQNSLKRVISNGTAEMLVISGYSGIGKTSLVRELHEPLVRAHGLFTSGKFDQYKNNIPYSIFGEAFFELIRQILTGNEGQIAGWRTNILTALGINARLMVDIIPQLELIIGTQPYLPELTAAEAENRFTTTFIKFISVFTSKDHPLVLFLDDLQWGDVACIKLLRALICDPETQYLLLVAAYRDNEVTISHPLMLALDSINKECHNLSYLTLSPLSLDDLTLLLADTFIPHETGLDQFAELIYEKTAGNPFFLTQFLTMLYEEKLVEFDALQSIWKWDMEQITAKGYSDNVVDLMMNKMRSLPYPTQNLLKIAASIGNTFELDTLRSILKTSEFNSVLADLLQEGLILNKSEGVYFFLHDRIQQAAYSLIPEEKRSSLHLQIARLMLSTLVEEKTFDVVNHYNKAIELIIEKSEKLKVAGLNLTAAKKARTSTAYSSALEYIMLATGLLDEEDWEINYQLAFELFRERAELEYLNSNYDQSKELIDLLIGRARTDLEIAGLYNILIVQNTLLANYEAAITAGREALRLLNLIVPVANFQDELHMELVRFRNLLGGRNISSLADEPELTDPQQLVSLELLSNMVVPARYSDNDLFSVVILLNVNYSLQYGPTAKSTVGYSCFGMFLSDKMDDFDDAYQFGLVALSLSERFHAMTQKCQSSFVLGHYLIHWVKHLREVDAVINEGMDAGLTSGEMQWTGYTMAYRLFPPFYRGEPIRQVLSELPRLQHFTLKTHNQWASDTLTGFRLALADYSESDFDVAAFDADEYLTACRQRRSFGALGRYYVLKLQSHYLFGEIDEAYQSAIAATELAGFFSSSISVPALAFYYCLTCTARYLDATVEEKKDLHNLIQRERNRMKIWAASCPENFLSQTLLMEAEFARIDGRELDAIRFYEQSIVASHKSGFIQNEALAFERAALFYLDQGFENIAHPHLQQARALYQRWGADKKVRQLDSNFPWLLKVGSSSNGTLDAQIGNIDALTVIKASQAISGEIVLDRLLDKLMRITMENAGAQKGFLLLYKGGEFSIAVEAVVDGVNINFVQSPAKYQHDYLPETLFNYISRTKEILIVDDATKDDFLSSDPYVIVYKPLSILCLPLLSQGSLIALLYLENHLLRGAFTADRISVLELLSAQAVISLENAQLYDERSKAEEKLRTSEEKYRQIFDHCGTALVIIEEDATISMCNKEFEVLSGYSRLEIEGILKWSETVATLEELRKMTEYHKLRRIDPEKAPQAYEFHFLDKFGVVKDVVVTVSTMPGAKQSMAALLDISERKRNEADRVRLVTAIEQSAEAIFITDISWHIIYANRACEWVTGYNQSELIGKHTHLFKSGKHDAAYYQNIKNTLDIGKAWSGEMTLKRKDGTIYEAEASNSAVRDENGKIINYVCTHRDVTKEHKLERDLRQSQKMEAIGTLAGGIAHDFNNILTAVIGYAELAYRKTGDDGSASRDIRRVLEASSRAKDLVMQILTFSRQKEQEKNEVHVATIVKEVCKLLRSSIPSTIEIHQNIQIAPNSDVVLADSTQIHQVLMNLGSNASYAMKENGGVLSVTLSEIEADAALQTTVPGIGIGNFIRISVSDTGYGMDTTVRERIFDPYFTTKKIGEGTGMGLAVVQGIVKSHNGFITVYSEPDIGTTFHIFLPKIEVYTDHTANHSEDTSVHGGSERILFVDDERMLTEMGIELFGSLGYKVTGVTNSFEALKIFTLAPYEFDLVITDMTMPGLTGKELAEDIMSIRSDIPIILCTGFSESINEKEAQELGVKAFVMKPYSMSNLDGVVRQVLGGQNYISEEK